MNPTISILDEHTAAHVAELFRAFSDTSRVRILSVIVKQEMNISALAELVGVTIICVDYVR
jgi:DNA-binding transcriptional ArsR family regulator